MEHTACGGWMEYKGGRERKLALAWLRESDKHSGLALCIKYREGVQQYGSIMVLIGGAKFWGKPEELNKLSNTRYVFETQHDETLDKNCKSVGKTGIFPFLTGILIAQFA